MDFMDEVKTKQGNGIYLGKMKDGRILASIRKEELRGRNCAGPCVNLVMRWCDLARVWCEGRNCDGCGNSR